MVYFYLVQLYFGILEVSDELLRFFYVIFSFCLQLYPLKDFESLSKYLVNYIAFIILHY